jgi:hypothetical protein
MKFLTIKSLFEKFSNVKLGPFGKIDLPLPPPPAFRDAIEYSVELPPALSYIETCNIPPFITFISSWHACDLKV